MGQDFDQSRRRFLRATGAGVAVATTLSGTAAATGSNVGQTPSNRTLNLELGIEPHTLDPVRSVNTARSWVLEQILDGLTTFPDGNVNAKGALADGFEVSPDNRTYRFHLNEKAVFHAGYGPVTAEDVVYSFERVAGADHSFREGYILDLLGVEHARDANGNYVPGSLGIEAIDSKTVEIRLQSPFHGALEVLSYAAFGIIPAGIVGDIPGYEGDMEYDAFRRSPVGTGPFEVAAWTIDESLTVERFDQYYGDKPWVGAITWDITPGGGKYERILSGDLDLWAPDNADFDPELRTVERTESDGTTFGTYGPMENGRTANFQAEPGLSIFYLGFNCNRVPKFVRQAMAYLVDQTTLVNEIWPGAAIPAVHVTPPSLYPGGGDDYQSHAETYPYDWTDSRVTAATNIMGAEGYGPGNPYELSYITFDTPTARTFADRIATVAADAHINVTAEHLSFNELVSRTPKGEMEAFFLGWVADWPGAENILQLVNPPYTQNENPHSVSSFNWGETSAASEAAAAFQTILDNQGPKPGDESNREQAYVRMEETNWEDVPMIPLMHGIQWRFWYDWVDVPTFGAMGPKNQKYTDVKLKPRQSSNGKGERSQDKGN